MNFESIKLLLTHSWFQADPRNQEACYVFINKSRELVILYFLTVKRSCDKILTDFSFGGWIRAQK